MRVKFTDIFFDLDRTLWDFETNSKVALKEIFGNFKLDKFFKREEVFLDFYTKINHDYWYRYGKGKVTKDELRIGRFMDTLRKVQVEDAVLAAEIGDYYVSRSPYQTVVFPNAISTLEDLKSQGYKLHIITNGFKEVQFIKLTNSGLINYFDVIVCSEEVGLNKPHPEVFHHALKLAETSVESSVMIGDDFNTDIVGANGVGMHSILFDPHNQHAKRNQIDKIQDLSEISNLLLGI